MSCGSRLQRLFTAIFCLAAALVFTGCRPRHSPLGGFFTYSSIDSQNFVLPPAVVPVSGPRLTIPIQVAANSGDLSACAIRQQWFSFYFEQAGARVQGFAQAPTGEAWAKSGGFVDMNAEWKAFLRALDALARRGCFTSSDAPALIRRQMTAAMALPDQDTLFYHYGFGLGGFIDLSSGMQFQIERILSKPVMDPVTHKVTNLDQMVTVYDVVRGSGSGVSLRLLRSGTYTHFETPTHPDVTAMNLPDRALAAQFGAASHLRLMLKTLVVSGSIDRPAMLLGAADEESLDAASGRLMAMSQTSCKNVASLPVTCAQFDGTVSVGPRLGITVNRRRVYVPVGNRLWSVLPRAPGSFKPSAPPSLRIQRLLAGQYVDVHPGPGADSFTQLMLLQGDRISW